MPNHLYHLIFNQIIYGSCMVGWPKAGSSVPYLKYYFTVLREGRKCRSSRPFAYLSTTLWRMGSGGICPRLPELGIRRREAVSYMPWQFYPLGKDQRYAVETRCGFQRRSGSTLQRKENRFPAPAENRTPAVKPIT